MQRELAVRGYTYVISMVSVLRVIEGNDFKSCSKNNKHFVSRQSQNESETSRLYLAA